MGLSFSPTNAVLQVIDPVDSSNNVGKQTYNFNLVQDQLHVTRQCLLVRFRENLEKQNFGEELNRRLHIVNKALEVQKTKPDSQE